MSNAAPSLANAAINLIQVRENAKKDLTKLLKGVKGEKILVLDKRISGPLGLVAEVDLLKKQDVTSIHPLTPTPLYTDSKNILYLVRPIISSMKIIASHFHQHSKQSPMVRRNYYIFFVPRKTQLCERVLSEQGIFGDVKTGEFPLELIPFDDDVLSLEMGQGFRECFLDGNPSVLFYVARSLMKLQSMFGIIPNIKGKGHMAARVWEMMARMRKEAPSTQYGMLPEIDTLILIDRQVDMVTPLLTQWTYEGLIDEVFGIKNSLIDVDSEVVGGKEPGKKKLALNSNDDLYKEIRDLNFRVLGPLLNKKAEYVKEIYENRTKLKGVGVTMTEMNDFMKDFKKAHNQHNYLQTHINLSAQIAQMTKSKVFDKQMDVEKYMIQQQESKICEDYIEDSIAKMDKFSKVLRFLCLLSLTCGIKDKKYDFYRKEIIQTYGFEAMFTLNNLEKLGMFNRSVKKNNWSALRTRLNLFTLPGPKEKEIDYTVPKDISFSYNGYSPLSVRLIEIASQGGWRGFKDVLDALPGKTFEVTQDMPFVSQRDMGTKAPESNPALSKTSSGAASSSGSSSSSSSSSSGSGSGSSSSRKPLTLVYFIGGVTFAEISALRFLGERETHHHDYIIATTKLINGGSLIRSVKEKIQNNLVRKSQMAKEEEELKQAKEKEKEKAGK